MPTVYNNSYVYLDGNAGILHKELDENPAPMTDYTISLWFRAHQLPADLSRSITLLTVRPAGFECAITLFGSLTCSGGAIVGSGDAFVDLIVSFEGIRTFNWYIMVLRSQAGQSQLEVREMNQNVVSQHTKSKFFPPGSSSLQIQRITLGIDDVSQQNFFVGNLRNFKVFESYLDDWTLRKAQFTYLYPIAGLLRVQIMMSDVDDIQSIAGNSIGSVISLVRNDQPLTKVIDFSPAQICWQPTKTEIDSQRMSLLIFNAKQSFQSLVVQLRSPSATFQAWVYRHYNPDFVNDQILFRHLGFVDLLFISSDPASLIYANIGRGNSGETKGKIPFPYNRWVFIEAINTKTQFKLSLYNNNGVLFDSRTISTSFVLPTRQHTMLIAKNFYGLIQGVKLFSSETPSQPGPHSFEVGNPASSTLLFFYFFVPDSITSTGSSFKNQAPTGLLGSLVLESGTLNFQRNMFVKRYEVQGSLNYGKGDIPAMENWDGVTCIDGRERLLITNALSHAQILIRTEEPKIDNYTLEMWVKPQFGYRIDAIDESWIAAIRHGQLKQIMMAFRVERDGSLYCFSSFSNDASRKIKFIDFSPKETRWIHISCSYDWPNRRAEGSLLANNMNYAYYDELYTENSMIQNQDYRLFMNTDPLNRGTKGSWSIAYSEVRLWNYARSLQDIKNSRFHQLNLPMLRPCLLTYLRLYSGRDSFLDFADPTLSKTLLTTGLVSWSPQTDLVVCPFGFYKGERSFNDFTDIEMQCYREGIVRLQVLSFKDSQTGLTVISPMYSKFRNSYVRDNIEQLYNFEWSLKTIEGSNGTKNSMFRQSLAGQKSNKELLIPSELVSEDFSGIYEISLKVSDNLMQEDIKQFNYRYRSLSCLNIYDKMTGLSFSEADIESNKDIVDVFFSYQYTDCSNYTLDKASMTFTIEVDNIDLWQMDHNFSSQTYKLRTLFQTWLPLNQVFFFKIRALWRSPGSTDIGIETYLIYQCRFISKLVISLKPSSLIMLKGETLVVGHQSSYSNVNQKSIADRSYSVRWQCPETLNQICQAQTQSTLRLDFETIKNSGVQLWYPQTITMVAITNFIQGDGRRDSTKSVDIIWVSIKPDAKIFLLDPEKITSRRNVTVQIEIDGLDEAVSSIQWVLEPKMNPSACFINRNVSKQLLIHSSCLSEGQTYLVTSMIIYAPKNFSIWNGTVSFRVPVSPSGGSLSCMPRAPKAYFDQVTCTASFSVSNSSQLWYQFFAKRNDTSILAVSPITTNPTIQQVLPPTVEVIVKVSDFTGSLTFLSRPLLVNNSATTKETIDEFDRNLQIIGFLYMKATDLQLLRHFTWMTQALLSSEIAINNETLFQSSLTSLIDYLTVYTLKQSAQSTIYFSDRLYLAQVAIQVLKQATLVPLTKASAYRQAMQIIQGLYISNSDVMDALNEEPMDVQGMALQVISQCMAGAMRLHQENFRKNDREEKERERKEIGETFRIARQMIIRIEEYMSSGLQESQSARFNMPSFNITIDKYSRLENGRLNDLRFIQIPNLTQSFQYHVQFSQAIQPTERQSLSIISFNVNPFIESNFTNQIATSQNALFFVYRDRNGKLLSQSQIPNAKIQMTFPFSYSPFIFLPNVAACAAMDPGENNWEKKYCETTYIRERSIISCSCQNLQFFSIIEEQLENPLKLPVILKAFKNWVSLIAIIYVFLVLIIGVSLTHNMDSQDFRNLREQEEQDGDKINNDKQISLVKLAFKRTMFFMDFRDENSLVSLFRLYLLLLHPVLQLNYRLDPHTPRFQRFLLLFSRLNLSFLLSFYLLRHFPNPSGLDSSSLRPLLAFIFMSSLLFAPLPSILFAPFRSRYQLLVKDKGRCSQLPQVQKVEIDAQGNGYVESDDNKDQVEARSINVEIDANIPIKLIFLLKPIPVDKIVKEQGLVGFCRGDPREVGEKLLELDQEWVPQIQEQKKAQKVPERSFREQKTKKAPISMIELTSIKKQRQFPQILIDSDDGPDTPKKPKIPLKYATKQNPEISIYIDAEKDALTPKISKEDLISNAYMITPMSQVKHKKFMDESMDEQYQQKNPTSSKKSHVQNIRQKHHQEEEKKEDTLEMIDPGSQGQSEDGNESDITIDTKVQRDERKDIIEIPRVFNRALGFLFVFALNTAIIFAVLNQYVKEDFKNKENPYIWVLSFFGSQLVGLFITNPLFLLLCALLTSRWLRFKKVFLARFFRESLYIFEDYQFAVQFMNTQMS